VLRFGTSAMAGPWPEALLLTMPAICVGFMYAALRWRTASIWPVILIHFVLTFTTSISTPRTIPCLIPLLAVADTLGFAGYGLFLLRNPDVRADGG
jgi:membrane protease YdiL (CAAX protease family)